MNVLSKMSVAAFGPLTVAASFVLGACSGGSEGAARGEGCTRDEGCAGGLYCGAELTCTSECGGPGDDACGPGLVCSSRGTCQSPFDGDGSAPDDCPNIVVNAAPVTPTVMLLIDQSGSMLDGFGGGDRWDAVREALTDPEDGVVTQLESSVIFGATLYTYDEDDDDTCPRLTKMAAAPNNANAIAALLSGNSPPTSGNTPTAESIDAVVASFPAADGPRVILLATDGDPDTCDTPNPNGLPEQFAGSVAAVQAAHAAGIEVYVLGVGDSDVTLSHLDQLARAGRGQNVQTGDAEAFVANNPTELASAFSEIIGDVRDCAFQLDAAVQPGKESMGAVTVDGTAVSYGADWQIEGGTVVRLLGATCDAYLADATAKVEATFPCGTVIL
jgi:hypothetical protein